jgi:hypothetical protein
MGCMKTLILYPATDITVTAFEDIPKDAHVKVGQDGYGYLDDTAAPYGTALNGAIRGEKVYICITRAETIELNDEITIENQYT